MQAIGSESVIVAVTWNTPGAAVFTVVVAIVAAAAGAFAKGLVDSYFSKKRASKTGSEPLPETRVNQTVITSHKSDIQAVAKKVNGYMDMYYESSASCESPLLVWLLWCKVMVIVVLFFLPFAVHPFQWQVLGGSWFACAFFTLLVRNGISEKQLNATTYRTLFDLHKLLDDLGHIQKLGQDTSADTVSREHADPEDQ